jgi:bile acid-coenzyme A ligase
MADAAFLDPDSCIESATGAPAAGAPLGLLLSAHARHAPDRPAVSFDRVTTTFGELDVLANRRARQLEGLGIGQDDRVVLALPNSLAFLECVFAVWKLGATVCPISDKLTPGEFASIVALAEPAAVLTAGAAGKDDRRSVLIAGPPPAGLPDTPLPPRSARQGRIMTSGGSSGRPKLIVDPFPSVWGPDKAGYRRPPRSTLLMASPLYHAGPFSTTLYALAQGSHAVCMTRFEPAEWLQAIESRRVDYIYAVPTIMTRIAKLEQCIADRADLSSVKTFLHMAAPCAPDTKRWWIGKLGPEKVFELYGGTERIGLTLIDGAEWLRHPGSVGKAAPGDEIVIVDDAGNELPRGAIGEVRFRSAAGPGTTYSYIGSETRICGDLDGYGDMGWLDADGYLYIADRRTDMILLGGANIYPAEIEAVIDGLPGVLGSAVIGLPDPDMGNRLHAIVELEPGSVPPAGAAFTESLRTRLSALKCPRTFEFTSERIRDDAGKVRRLALRQARLPTETGRGKPARSGPRPAVKHRRQDQNAAIDAAERFEIAGHRVERSTSNRPHRVIDAREPVFRNSIEREQRQPIVDRMIEHGAGQARDRLDCGACDRGVTLPITRGEPLPIQLRGGGQEAEQRRFAERTVLQDGFGREEGEVRRQHVEDAPLVLVDLRLIVGREAAAGYAFERPARGDRHPVMSRRQRGQVHRLPVERRPVDTVAVAQPVELRFENRELAGEDRMAAPGSRPILAANGLRAAREVYELVGVGASPPLLHMAGPAT